MIRLFRALVPVLVSAFRSRRDLVLENLALRQQLSALAFRQRPSIRLFDRVFWLALRRLWSGWRKALVIVQPETVVRWHREGFRFYWARLSRRTCRPGRPPLPVEVRNLIRRMAAENGWGATRIHGELLHLGIDVSERSVSRYLHSFPRPPRPSQSWTTFLKNHLHGGFRRGRRAGTWGTFSNGKASRSCWMTQAAVGLVVTPNQATSRRRWPMQPRRSRQSVLLG